MPHGKARIRTLVVDDYPGFVCAFCAFLDLLSNVDVIAKGCSGRDAVLLAHEWVLDLVLMDVKMPEMTGVEAACQLRREMPDVVVILMSAFEDRGNRKASEESGAFAFVMKEAPDAGTSPSTRTDRLAEGTERHYRGLCLSSGATELARMC